MEKKRPQLSLDELYQLKWLLGGGLSLLASWSVFYLDLDAWTLMGLVTAGVATALIRPAWPARVPRWAHRLAFPAILVWFVADLAVTRDVLAAVVRLDLVLLLYRGTTYRRKRDDLQLIVLGLFLIVVAGVLTVSLVFAVQILLFTACSLAFLLVVTLVDVAERNGAGGETGSVPRWAGLPWRSLWTRLRQSVDWRIATLAVALFIGVVGVSALLFLAIPRFQLENSLFLERLISRKARSGFTETINFGEVTEIQTDNSLAVSVDVSDRKEIPSQPYWRMLVLDEYRNGSFRLSPVLRRAGFGRERTAAETRGTARATGAAPVLWTFYLEAGISRYLPLLGPFESLRFGQVQSFRLGSDLGVVALRNEPGSMTAYRVEGMTASDLLPDAHFARRLAEGGEARAETGVMLRVGVGADDQAALREMVAEITGGATLGADEFAARAGGWLMRRHPYSLTPRIPGGDGDVVVRWMRSNGGGHCELFAGGLVLLARTAGFPTRVVTGFRGGSWNGYSNNFTLRNSDAHAWCEIYDERVGAWRRADATPGASRMQVDGTSGGGALAQRTDRGWTARLESLRVFWYRRIVNFDQQSQVETLQAVKSGTVNFGRAVRSWLAHSSERIRKWATAPWDAGRVVAVMGAAVAVAMFVWLWHRLGRGQWRWLRPARPGVGLDPVRIEAGRWLRMLNDASRRDRGEIVSIREPGAEPVHASGERGAVESELQRLRFGAPGSWPQPEAVFRRARKALKQQRRKR